MTQEGEAPWDDGAMTRCTHCYKDTAVWGHDGKCPTCIAATTNFGKEWTAQSDSADAELRALVLRLQEERDAHCEALKKIDEELARLAERAADWDAFAVSARTGVLETWIEDIKAIANVEGKDG